ncbi:amidohydrolase [Pseudomaricurvus alkylphenolicus]|uniref:amidohydrolase n=1 Tax=Pseudomaricurvus alkylphenolicus TaxID=1306991 RepID=UPI001424211C|nr:amidohydrolase [Pseudomaricurvus alkylphenolicus]NIB40536.1 amidohydrolase [Pseudomaricurvus alkylphenolicus]
MIKKKILTHLFALMSVSFAGMQSAAVAQPVADTILTNGKIYTLSGDSAWAQAVAINDGKISYVGTAKGADQLRGANTKIVDLKGKMALPGLNDLHVHPVYGFTTTLFECSFSGALDADAVQAVVSQCVKENPDAEWIIGGQWRTDFFLENDIPSPRRWLDRISGGKAIILRDTSFHNHWANSKALALAGFDRHSEEIPGGKIVRDEKGEPNGLLYESAADPVLAKVPDWTDRQYLQAATKSIKAANSFGITGMKAAMGSPAILKALKTLDDRGQLSVHTAVATSIIPMLDKGMNLDEAAFKRLINTHQGKFVRTAYAKVLMDGVPSSSRTAAMLSEYTPAHKGAESNAGMLLYPPDILGNLIGTLDRLGITVKVHAAGDRSVRVTLDAIESARHKNGNSGLRHEVSHAGFIDPEDIPRFAELNAVAEVSPYIWFPSVKVESIQRAVGQRGQQYWPIRTLMEQGAEVVAGSDWPAGALSSMNPWVGMEAMISRRNPWGDYPEDALWPEQGITLQQALQIYTLNGSRGIGLGEETGSIAVGKRADVIVLNQNLFEIPTEEIGNTKVVMTLFGGEVVHQQ